MTIRYEHRQTGDLINITENIVADVRRRLERHDQVLAAGDTLTFTFELTEQGALKLEAGER